MVDSVPGNWCNVKNTGTSTASVTKVMVAALDANGKVIDTEATVIGGNDFPPGATAPFSVQMAHARQAPQVKVVVYGRKRSP